VTVLPIRTLGDPVLREPPKPVETFDDALRALVDDMFETMYAAPGVGLAANQVGIGRAFFVYDDREGHTRPTPSCPRSRVRRRSRRGVYRSRVRTTTRSGRSGSGSGGKT
jgi:peptide deformylase